jgi:hypothetical protein
VSLPVAPQVGAGGPFSAATTAPPTTRRCAPPLIDLPVSRDLDALIRPENAARQAASHGIAELKDHRHCVDTQTSCYRLTRISTKIPDLRVSSLMASNI